ncbi:proton-conducting transporter membrane subunit [Isosphaeraceae bacterium EP7]
MILAFLAILVAAGAAAFFLKSDTPRRALLVLTAAFHALFTAGAWANRPATMADGWLALDETGLLFLSIISVLFLPSSFYAVGYLRREAETKRHIDYKSSFRFDNGPEASFTGCLLMLLATMTLVTVSQHFGLLWVAIELTTLVSAPLVYFHRQPRSLEATWKYLLICSVGIALALMGNFMLAVAVSKGDASSGLILSKLIEAGPSLRVGWLEAAFLFILVGYGTKAGLAPLHTWLPDVYSEAPSVVTALLAGALSNCAFLGILRTHQVMLSAGPAGFSGNLLIGFGLVSMAVAAIFIVGQNNYKRMLAYSSVEYMGILALGVGLGGVGAYGAGLFAVCQSMGKAALFLTAGNILAAYKTKSGDQIRGLGRSLPVTGLLWGAGLFAIAGIPPFGAFFGEFVILKAALDQGRFLVAATYLALLAVIFVGMANLVLPMGQGKATATVEGTPLRESLWATVPPAALGLGGLALGLYIPPALESVLHMMAHSLGGQ